MGEFLTIPEIIRTAEEKLPREIWDFGSGGAETETTLRRNRAAMGQYALRPRVLVDVSQRDTSATVLGRRLSFPVMLAPVGLVTRFDPAGALAAARAAERMGTVSFVSTVAAPPIEEVAAGVSTPQVFQLYNYGDRDWVRSIVKRAERAGYFALCLTADIAVYGRRERDLHNRFFPRLLHGDRPNLVGAADSATLEGVYMARLTWEFLDWLRDVTSLPVILKGVMTPEDAERAVEHGVSAVYVSNHGGRQLDHAPGTLEVLPEIVQAVGGRAEVLVDGGFVRGTDVVKGLALGASAVLVGKLLAWGLAAGGEDGLVRALEILKTELDVAMALIGANRVADIGPQSIRPALPIEQGLY